MRRPSLHSSASLIALLACLVAGEAQEAVRNPILRIEVGQHTGGVAAIDTDQRGRWVVSASSDETVRVWNATTGHLERTLRPSTGLEIAPLGSVAISDDGKLIACGGATGQLYLFSRANGQVVGHANLAGHSVDRLVFSPDRRMLAATLADRSGLRLFAVGERTNVVTAATGTASLRLIAEDADYSAYSAGADFSPDGTRLVTTTADGTVNLYDVGRIDITSNKSSTLTPNIKVSLTGGAFRVKFSPDGAKIAVGSIRGAVVVLSAKNLRFLYQPDQADISGIGGAQLGDVVWSKGGDFLFASGRFWSSNVHLLVRRWPAEGRGKPIDLPTGTTDTITDLAALPDDSIAFGSLEPNLGVLGANGDQKWLLKPDHTDWRNTRLAGDCKRGFELSNDGSKIAFNYISHGSAEPATFSLTARSLSFVKSDASLSPPRVSASNLDIQSWCDSQGKPPTLNGKRLLSSNEWSKSLAIAPDGQSFLLATDKGLRRFGLDGTVEWGLSSLNAWAINVSPNGRIAIAAFLDGTIRWYRYSDGRELAAFFPDPDGKRWVVWTPSGYYDASPGGEELLGWQVNNGPDQAADFYPASRFREAKYRPDVVSKILATLDEAEAVQLANAEQRKATAATSISQSLPPVVAITSPEDGTRVSSNSVTLQYSIRMPSGEPVTRLRVLVDGRPAQAKQAEQQAVTVTIPERDCQVSLIAENRFSVSVPATVHLAWASTARGVTPAASHEEEFIAKPKLYVLAVGESNYQNPVLRLGFAAKDAKDFAAAMTKQKGILYRDVEVKLLMDAPKEDIEDGLDWLQHQVTSRDVGMLFLAGHGIDDSNNIYYFLPSNADLDRLKRTGLVFSDIKTTMETVAGKAVMFVDTCHSGSVMGTRRGAPADINGIVNELASAENGVVVFTASTGRQYSLEDPQWQNGAFTKALVEGIAGKAAYSKDSDKITVNMLDVYISERVKELTKGQQTPATTKPNTVPDFPVAVKQ